MPQAFTGQQAVAQGYWVAALFEQVVDETPKHPLPSSYLPLTSPDLPLPSPIFPYLPAGATAIGCPYWQHDTGPAGADPVPAAVHFAADSLCWQSQHGWCCTCGTDSGKTFCRDLKHKHTLTDWL